MKTLHRLLMLLALVSGYARAHGPEPMPLQNVPLPPVPGLLDGADPIVVNKDKAIALGKALFWDVNIGSDGMACASCHFHAGADIRIKNQINPGVKSAAPSGQTFEPLPSGGGGPNYTLRLADFPTFQYNNPIDQASGIKFVTDDVISSVGTFSGHFSSASRFSGANDNCARNADPVFHVGSVGTRRVEPRNAPTVINAIFNHRNFWDGRANNIFNGSSPWGERDPNAGVWIKVNARSAVKQRLHLQNSSLASLATAPPLSDTEMACQQRNWPDIGRKLLYRQPLQQQKVHNEDSVLGGLSFSTPGNLKPGLNTTYRTLITQAFHPKYWSFNGTGPFGAPAGQAPYTQMEANFVMFFGLALQLYQGTLVSDQAPLDRSQRDSVLNKPTWEGLGYPPEKVAQLNRGFDAFVNHHCNICHGGPAVTLAAVATNSMLVDPVPGKVYGADYAPIAYGQHALGLFGAAVVGINKHISLVTRDATLEGTKLMDMGFANTGVTDPANDLGLGAVDDFGNPLSFADQYVQYLLGNTAAIKDPGVTTTRSCDFVKALATNTAVTSATIFTALDGVEIDGTREGVLRNQDCLNASRIYIPTIAAANNALATRPAKLAVAKQAVFKIPGLRNVELTGPYMHNGSMATLEQVVEFYARRNNVNPPDKHSFANTADALAFFPEDRVDIVAFLKALTDERVRYEQAPFDHPELVVPTGHAGDHLNVVAGNVLHPDLGVDEFITVAAVGAGGSSQPLSTFDAVLAP